MLASFYDMIVKRFVNKTLSICIKKEEEKRLKQTLKKGPSKNMASRRKIQFKKRKLKNDIPRRD
jgi:hypothetical protein